MLCAGITGGIIAGTAGQPWIGVLVAAAAGLIVAAVLIEAGVRRARSESARREAIASMVEALWTLQTQREAGRRGLALVVGDTGAIGGTITRVDDDGMVAELPSVLVGVNAEAVSPAIHTDLEEAVDRGEVVTRSFEGGSEDYPGVEVRHGTAVHVPIPADRRTIGVLSLFGPDTEPRLRETGRLQEDAGLLAAALSTARAWDEETRRAKSLEAEHTARMQFLSTVSHELRTPLTSIKAAVDLLIEEASASGGASELGLLGTIGRGADRLTALVADLMDVARLQASTMTLEKEPARIRDPITSAAALVSPIVREKHQQLDVEVPNPGPLALLDRRRFEQILLNLLSNASRFTPEHGSVWVTTHERGDEVVIEVRDDGPGVPPGEVEAIFQPFYRVKSPSARRIPGSGLGLAIARSLAELHGGRLWAESEPGEGSSFFLAVPVIRTAEPAMAETAGH